MDENLKLNVTVPENYNGQDIKIVFLEGQAPAQNDPRARGVTDVSIRSLAPFIKAKQYAATPNDNAAVVSYSAEPEKAFIKIDFEPGNALAPVFHAPLTPHPDFTAWGINRDKYFTQHELEIHVRKYAHCFEEVATAKQLIQDLRNFKVKYEQTVEKSDDRQGNTKDLQETAIKFAQGELPKTLALACPFFKHTPRVSFTVEIEIKRGQNNLPLFAFYSMDTELKARIQAEAIISDAVSEIREFFAVVEV